MKTNGMKTLRVILGDQLNHQHSWFKEVNNEITYLMMETKSEMTYVSHHIQKIVAFMHAMRTFSKELIEKGHKVIYVGLSDPNNLQTLNKNIQKIVAELKIKKIEFQEPDEYRLDQEIRSMIKLFGIDYSIVSSEHFLTERNDLELFFENKKIWRMEDFYRHMRLKKKVLVQDNKPIGGKWNFDHENRKKWNPDDNKANHISFNHDVTNLMNEVIENKISYIGNINLNNFKWPCSRAESLALLNHFINNNLDNFGTYQDAMAEEDDYLFHSLLSFSLNIKLLHPLEVIELAVNELQNNLENLNSIEGFVRQILGWREYIRGVYWTKMPGYEENNFFNFSRKIPEYFWTADTQMNCLKHSISNSLENAYAHHIQRLMVIGNFLLLTESDPRHVQQWFLGVYIDAIEWVELPNVNGMSQYADGGLLATKPYVSSGSYINKMSNYCGSCKYNVKTKFEKNSCPFNALYWNFFLNNQDKLSNNPRLGIVKMQLSKMQDAEKKQISLKSKELINDIEKL